MGREIRKVPPNWEPPKTERFDYQKRAYVEVYQPMFDRPFKERMDEWIDGYNKWNNGIKPSYCEDCECKGYWECEGPPPDPAYHRPDWNEDEATWFQVYETVSEGTPVTPPFATRQELVEYLVANGDFWDQRRRADGVSIHCEPWSRKSAESFVFGSGFAVSAVVSNGKVMSGVEALTEMEDKKQ